MATVGTVTATTSKGKDWKSVEVRFDGFANLPAAKGKDDVLSPEFTRLHHKWRLGIFPGGHKDSDDGMVSIFLEHCSSKSITVEYGFCIRDKEGNAKKDLVHLNEFVPLGWHHGTTNFCERSQIIDALVDGTLIIEVRMKRTVIAGTVTETTSKDQDWKTFDVRFVDFENLPTSRGEAVSLPELTCFGHKWRLKIYPGGHRISKYGMIAIYLRNQSKKRITVQYGFSIRDKKEGNTKEDFVSSVLGTEFEVGDSWGHHNFCERSQIIDALVDGALIIEVRMKKHPTKSTDNNGRKKHATVSENDSNKQSSQKIAHENKRNTSAENYTSADDNSKQPPLKKPRTTNENETDSSTHTVPPVVGHGISKADSAIGLKSYRSPTQPPPSDVPTKKGNDTMAGKSLLSHSCNVAGDNNAPKEHLQVSINTCGQDKASKQNAKDSSNSSHHDQDSTVIKDEETDDEDGPNKAEQEENVFMIIMHPNKFSELRVALPRGNNTTFADLRREIEADLDLPDFEFLLKGGGVVQKNKQEKKWNYNKAGVSGSGSFSSPFHIYIREAKTQRGNIKQGHLYEISKPNVPVPDADTLRKAGVYMECSHLREILPRLACHTKSHIAETDFFGRLVHNEEGWAETRKYLYPGRGEAWKSYHKDPFTTASTDAHKLMISVQMPGPPEHFLGVIRFPASRDSSHAWDFAIIDSLDNDTYTEEVQDLFETKSTLANGYDQIHNDEPNASHASALWKRVPCVKQGESECGCRMILHFYIAAFCNSLVEFEQKIDNLNGVENLPSRVRHWAADWFETNDKVDEPEWLGDVIRK